MVYFLAAHPFMLTDVYLSLSLPLRRQILAGAYSSRYAAHTKEK